MILIIKNFDRHLTDYVDGEISGRVGNPVRSLRPKNRSAGVELCQRAPEGLKEGGSD